MKLSFIALVIFSVSLVSVGPAVAGDKDSFRIAMVLWRGITEAERGFMDFLALNEVDVVYETYDLDGSKNKLPWVIAKIKSAQPDLVYTFGTTVTTDIAGTLADADSDEKVVDIPIVFNIVADPVEAGLVGHFDGSGRNLTGMTHLVPIDAQLRAIKQLDDFRKIGVVYNPLEMNSVGTVEKLEKILTPLKDSFEIVRSPISIGSDGLPQVKSFPDVVRLLVSQNVDLIYLPSDSFIIDNSAELIDQINVFGIPTFSATEEPIRKGGALMGIVSTYYNVGKFAGFKARQILVEGKDPGEIPIEMLKRFTVLVNMDTARELDYYPPVATLKLCEIVKD